MNNRLIVALDLNSKAEALQAVKELGPKLSFVKVGMELFIVQGQIL